MKPFENSNESEQILKLVRFESHPFLVVCLSVNLFQFNFCQALHSYIEKLIVQTPNTEAFEHASHSFVWTVDYNGFQTRDSCLLDNEKLYTETESATKCCWSTDIYRIHGQFI